MNKEVKKHWEEMHAKYAGQTTPQSSQEVGSGKAGVAGNKGSQKSTEVNRNHERTFKGEINENPGN